MRSRTLLSWPPFLGAPAERALGFVVVPSDGRCAAVAGQDGAEHDDGGCLVRSALAVDDGYGAGAGPVLAHGADVFAFDQLLRGRVHAEAEATEGTAPAARGGLQHGLADKEGGVFEAAPGSRFRGCF